ncbi:MAG: hypothetical protein ACF8CQ_19830 [Rhodopirellula sp. JB044]|uniref:hypothetical protein n=1 Tax=Rhodopirellula sp. JB044 TaxID=3342844 RepID=UPI00370A378E
MSQKQQVWIGIAFWAIVLVFGGVWMIGGRGREQTGDDPSVVVTERSSASPASLMLGSLWTPNQDFVIADPTGVVNVGDVVFAPRLFETGRPENGIGVQDPHSVSDWHEVGYVTSVRIQKGAANQITVSMFDPDAWSDTATFTVHRNSGRMEDVLATLMPREKRAELQQRLKRAFELHAESIAKEIMPLIVESTRATVPIVESAMVESVERHRDEIDALVSRYREEIVRERIVPLVREEVLPIVRAHGQEPAESIGREVWNRASLWRFGWRAIYDKSPLPERELVVEEWRRFVDEEVVPIVEDHLDEIAVAVENMIRDLAANDKLRSEIADVANTIASDPEAQRLLRTVLREAIVDNERIREAWSEIWTSADAQARLRRAGQRIEPLLRELGDELMGTREAGIEPGFARVLRNQILSKDRTWITITPGGGDMTGESAPRLEESRRFMPYPVVYVVQNHNL